MNATEAAALCRLAKAACPQQAFDEYTPDAWHMVLDDLRFEDCRDALKALVKRSPFVAPAEIRGEVRRIRDKRIADYGPFDPPAEITDYHQWLGGMRKAIADGSLTRENRREILPPKRDMSIIEGTVKVVSDE